MKPHWQGVFPAVTTQLKRDQSLDLAAAARHIETLTASGVSGLVVCGSPGENQALTRVRTVETLMLSNTVKVPGGQVATTAASRLILRSSQRPPPLDCVTVAAVRLRAVRSAGPVGGCRSV